MWRPSVSILWRRSASLVLRLGHSHIQLWQSDIKGQGKFELLKSISLETLHFEGNGALSRLIGGLKEAIPNEAKITVVADSKWVPVMLLNTGKEPLSSDQVRALAQHRFSELYGHGASHWTYLTNYLSGDQHCLAFGCPLDLGPAIQAGLDCEETIKQSVDASRTKVKLISLQPTFLWSWGVLQRKGIARDRCFVLMEDDRALIAFYEKGKITAFHPAGPQRSVSSLSSELPTVLLRAGMVDSPHSTMVATFEKLLDSETSASDATTTWHSFLAKGRAA